MNEVSETSESKSFSTGLCLGRNEIGCFRSQMPGWGQTDFVPLAVGSHGRFWSQGKNRLSEGECSPVQAPL